ncbi:hypothetical protein V6N12_005322 [Hibiscus sabdariffa]|uniref:Uncharacterized protein n=1 Tax=Hibiscus sabdariffa TaxID=183260 RepID=A0ABR2CP47_9ROSI
MSSVGILHGEASFHRDFDLNNGPAVDEGIHTQLLLFLQFCLIGTNLFQLLRLVDHKGCWAPPTGATPYNPDVYRGPVLSSAPALPFPSTPFQYLVFPFGTTFPLPSTSFSGSTTTYADSSSGGRFCFPPVHSQLLGPAGAVPSHYPRPPYVSLPDCNNSGAESGRKWGRQGLDLNAGPGGPDIEGRDETAPLASRHLSVASSQALAEEQARMYQLPGGVLKRKEPEGGWDGYKQSSWQ